MGKKDKVLDFEGLDEWSDWLKGLQDKAAVERFQSRILRTAGLRTLEYAEDLTPVKTGDLKGSLSMGARGNVFEIKVGKVAYVAVGTTVEYAEHVEEGFTQERGRFVPGYWKGDTFHYIPYKEAKAAGIGGMVLTGKIIEGAHMFRDALDLLDDDINTIVEYEFRRLYAELIGR